LVSSGWPTILVRLIHNKATHYLFVFSKNYLAHFTPNFLFLKGADHNQQSIPGMGQFMVVFAPFLIWGLFVLIKKALTAFSWQSRILLAQIFISPLAASTTMNAIPHALRTFCGLPAWQIIIACGLFDIGKRLKRVRLGKTSALLPAATIFLIAFLLNFGYYLRRYYLVYPRDYSSDWQYGHKQAVNFAWENKDKYGKIYFSRDYGEPYIFFLFYTQYPPAKYQQLPKVRTKRYDWVWVDQFDKFYFPDFSDPGDSVLEIYEREKDSGSLLFIGMPGDIPLEWKTGMPIFTIKEINFLNGKMAFEIGSF